jgi:hypothetical protein
MGTQSMNRFLATLCVAAAILLGVLLLPWDGGPLAWMPKESEVARSFEKRHRSLRVISVKAGRGDNDGRVYSITYTPHPGGPTNKAEWSVFSSGCFFGWKLESERLGLSAVEDAQQP